MSHFDEDEWFFKSVKDYEELFMYDLQHPASALTWSSNENICIVCSVPGSRSEISQLSVPHKLLSPGQSGLSKDRDFKVINGCFHDEEISDIVSMPESRTLITTSERENDIRLWRLVQGDSSDVIQSVDNVKNPRKTSDPSIITVPNGHVTEQIAFGSHGNNLCVYDLHTKQIIQHTADDSLSDRLCGATWCDPHTLLLCSRTSGSLVRFDTRSGDITKSTSSSMNHCFHDEEIWSMNVSSADGAIYTINTQGNVIIYKAGQLQKSAEVRVDVGGQGHPLNIKCCPTKTGRFSISDMNNCINIYEATTKKETLQPVFTHQGHRTSESRSLEKVKVKSHIWHPTIPSLLLSSDSSGALHAWKYCLR